MSSHHNVYVGPYLQVPIQAKQRTASRLACSAHCGKSGFTSKERFCSACGASVVQEEVHSTVEHVPQPGDLGAQWVDAMFFPDSLHERSRVEGAAIWLPNHGGIGHFLSAQDGAMVLELDDEAKAKMLSAFVSRYGEFISAWERELGHPLAVRMGVVGYRS